jgi:hypothetical protein
MIVGLTMASKHKTIYPMATSLNMVKIKDIASNPRLQQKKNHINNFKYTKKIANGN